MVLNSCYRRCYGYRRQSLEPHRDSVRGPYADLLRNLVLLAGAMALLAAVFVAYAWPHDWWPHIVILPLGAALAVFAAPLVYLLVALCFAPDMLVALVQTGVEKLRAWLRRRRSGT